jgi:hypothetical protein
MTNAEIVLLAMLPFAFAAAIAKGVVVAKLRERRHLPVLLVVSGARWFERDREPCFRDALATELARRLGLSAKPEAGMRTGTHVDLHFEFADEHWFLTLKQKLDNQKRLILQGELSDIIDECRQLRLSRAVVVIALARSGSTPGQRAQTAALQRHVRRRTGRLLRDRKELLDLVVYLVVQDEPPGMLARGVQL